LLELPILILQVRLLNSQRPAHTKTPEISSKESSLGKLTTTVGEPVQEMLIKAVKKRFGAVEAGLADFASWSS